MKNVYKNSLFCFLFIAIGCSLASAQSLLVQAIDESDARAIANDQTLDSPAYKSATVETRTFTIMYTPSRDGEVLGFFSDDGVDAWIDGRPVVQRFSEGQHLPSLEKSFRSVEYYADTGEPVELEKGQSYQIDILYSNTVWAGEFDIDGLTVFAYKGDACRGKIKSHRAVWIGSSRGFVSQVGAGGYANPKNGHLEVWLKWDNSCINTTGVSNIKPINDLTWRGGLWVVLPRLFQSDQGSFVGCHSTIELHYTCPDNTGKVIDSSTKTVVKGTIL